MKLLRLDEFRRFLDSEATQAIQELENVAEGSRQHLQKLVYTNIIDRFDTTIDHLFLDNVLVQPVYGEILKFLSDPLSEGEVFRLLISSEDEKAGHVKTRSQSVLRDKVLRKRHSTKVRKFFDSYLTSENIHVPRVNPSNGTISPRFKQQNKKIPASLIGYTDWLYSRRNAIVHGGGSVKMMKHDLGVLEKTFKVIAAEKVKLKLGSLTNAVNFYKAMVDLMRNATSQPGEVVNSE